MQRFYIEIGQLVAAWQGLNQSVENTAYNDLKPDQNVRNERLVALARDTWPVESTGANGKQFIDPQDIFYCSLISKNPEGHESLVPANGLNRVGYLYTLHHRGPFYKNPQQIRPTAAAALVQMEQSGDEIRQITNGRPIVAYEWVSAATLETIPGWNPDLQNHLREEGIHSGAFALYTGPLPEELSRRPVLCREKLYNPEAFVA